MFMFHRSTMVMSPEFKAWLKRPTRKQLDHLAEMYGYVVKNHSNAGNNVLLFKNGECVARKKNEEVMCYIDAIKVIKKREGLNPSK